MEWIGSGQKQFCRLPHTKERGGGGRISFPIFLHKKKEAIPSPIWHLDLTLGTLWNVKISRYWSEVISSWFPIYLQRPPQGNGNGDPQIHSYFWLTFYLLSRLAGNWSFHWQKRKKGRGGGVLVVFTPIFMRVFMVTCCTLTTSTFLWPILLHKSWL
jgi:hypothetical protein